MSPLAFCFICVFLPWGNAASSSHVGRSGSTTPSTTPSRPLSALSNASQASAAASGSPAGPGPVVRRRHPPGSAARLKPRPMSIAGTSVEQEQARAPLRAALQRRDSASGQAKGTLQF